MKHYNFKRLINKYSVDFVLYRETEGKYISGKWVAGNKEQISMRGAIVPMSEKKIYSSGGTYTADDRELYVLKPLELPLSDLKVVYKGNAYAVEQGRNFEEYADVAIYNLKWVGVVQ